MGSKNSKKQCGCPVIKFTGKDSWMGTLHGQCDKCRYKKATR